MLKPEEWLTEIDNALEFRKSFSREEKWDSLEKSYMNDPDSDTAIGPNLIYSYGDSLTSSLIVPDPEVLVAASTRFGLNTALIVENLDNQLIKRTKLKRACDGALLNGYLYGKQILKIGYDSEYGWSPYFDIGKAPNMMGMSLTQFDKSGNRIEYNDIKPGWPWVREVLPHDFVVPWGSVYLDEAPWCAHRIIRLTEDLKNDPKYINTKRLEPDISMESFMQSYKNVGAQRMRYTEHSAATQRENRKCAYTELWEIHDRASGMIFVVTRDYDKFLRKTVDAVQLAIGGLPFVAGDFVKHPRSFWTTPLSYYLGQIQATQFDISLQAEKHRRINNLKFLVRENVISEEDLTRIMSADVGGYVKAKTGSSMDLRQVIVPLPQGSMMDFGMMSENNRRDARDMVGFSRNQLGEFDASSRRTAREATFAREGSMLRTNKRSSGLVDLYLDAIDKFNKLIFKFWTTPRDIMIESGYVSATGPQLESDYAYDMTLSTKRSLSKAERKFEALQVLTQFAVIPGVNLQALFKLLTDAANDPHFENLLPGGGGAAGAANSSGAALPTIPSTGSGGGQQ